MAHDEEGYYTPDVQPIKIKPDGVPSFLLEFAQLLPAEQILDLHAIAYNKTFPILLTNYKKAQDALLLNLDTDSRMSDSEFRTAYQRARMGTLLAQDLIQFVRNMRDHFELAASNEVEIIQQ